MTIASIDRISEFEGQEVTIRGWLFLRTSKGKLHFLKVRDGTGIIQCVLFKNDIDPETFELASHLGQESSLEVSGVVRADPRSPMGYEIGVNGLKVLQVASEYPITPKSHGVAHLMAHRHLWLRSRKQHAILRVRAQIIGAIRDYLDSRGFVLVDSPIFTPAACEGTTTLFETDYFGSKAYLTQSGQLYMEAACMSLGKVYCFGPTFRAEKSKTRRHLTEFWMVEPEVAYMDLEEDMDLTEDFLVEVVARVLDRCKEELKTLERDTSRLEMVRKPFPRITYRESLEVLARAGVDKDYGSDYGGDEETVLTQQFDRPVIVHRWPREVKAFYMKRDPEDPSLVLGMDVLAPEGYGEIVGGGQREDDLAVLEQTIEEHGLPKEAFEWYLDLRRFGTVPHAGFGLGVERTVGWICGRHHVRETIPFPRLLDKMYP